MIKATIDGRPATAEEEKALQEHTRQQYLNKTGRYKPQVLNPNLYRAVGGGLIPRSRLEQMLDAGCIEVKMSSLRWWQIRRNGKTQTWKKDPNRIRIPFSMGFKGHGAITEADFIEV